MKAYSNRTLDTWLIQRWWHQIEVTVRSFSWHGQCCDTFLKADSVWAFYSKATLGSFCFSFLVSAFFPSNPDVCIGAGWLRVCGSSERAWWVFNCDWNVLFSQPWSHLALPKRDVKHIPIEAVFNSGPIHSAQKVNEYWFIIDSLTQQHALWSASWITPSYFIPNFGFVLH